jgi:regulator of cell morphogenesis and NO signaling
MNIDVGAHPVLEKLLVDWRERPLSELIHHLVDKHHAFTRDALHRATARMKTVEEEGHDDTQLATFVAALADELLPHLQREERVLFPYILSLESAHPAIAPFGHVKHPIRVMLLEHEAALELFAAIRDVTDNYRVDSQASGARRLLYAALQALEMDLRLHTQLENDVLFPRAIALESERTA